MLLYSGVTEEAWHSLQQRYVQFTHAHHIYIYMNIYKHSQILRLSVLLVQIHLEIRRDWKIKAPYILSHYYYYKYC